MMKEYPLGPVRGILWELLILALPILVIITLSSCASVPVRPTITTLPESQDFRAGEVQDFPDYAKMIQDFVNAEWEDDFPYAVHQIEFIRAQFIPQAKGMYLYYGVYISHGPEMIKCIAAFWVLLDDENHPQLRGVYPVETKIGI